MNFKANRKIVGFLSVLALSAMAFAQAPAAEAAAPAAEQAAPAAEAAAPEAAASVAAAPEAAAPAEPAATEAAAPAQAAPEAAPAEEAPAPVAVRGGETAPQEQKPATKVVYQTVYTAEPTAVRSTEYVPVRTVYVTQTSDGKDTVTFDELRGLVPVKSLVGIQGSIGSYIISSDRDFAYPIFEDYYGMTWRAGVFTILPLTEYTVGLRLGVLFEQSDASTTETYVSNSITAKFKQRKIDVPVLFAFKGARSSFMFEVGTQVSFPIKDEFKISYEDEKSRIDMLDKDYRKSVDWDIVMGFSVKANQYVGLDFMINGGISNLYECNKTDYDLFNLNSLSATAFTLGFSLYLF